MSRGFDNTEASGLGDGSGIGPPTSQLRLGQREIESLLPSFDPSNASGISAEDWVGRVAKRLAAFGVQDHQALVIIGMKLRGAARKWFDEMDDFNTWEEFKEKFMEYFTKDVSQSKIKRGLEKKKSSSESVEEYVYTKFGLAKRGRYTDDHLMQYIIDEIPGESNRKILCHARYATLPELTAGIKLVLRDEPVDSRERKRKSDYASSQRRDLSPRKRSPRRRDNRRERSRSTSRDIGRGRRSDSRGESDRDKDDADRSAKRQSEKISDEKLSTRVRRCFLCQATTHLLAKCPKNPKFQE